MKISLLEAPICKGSPTDGTQFAYKRLTENGIGGFFEDGVRFVPMTPCFSDAGKYPETPLMKDSGEVMSVSRRLFANVRKELMSGSFPLIIGGDHSVAMGSIAGASSVLGKEKLSVIYIDGHTDINTERSTLTGFIHGMPLAAAMGLCSDTLTVGNKINIFGKNIYIVGARSIDDGEYSIMRENGVHLCTADEVKTRGISSVMTEITDSIQGGAVHISFDVDFLDETVFSSTSYRMPNGLDLNTLYKILDSAFSTGRVCSMDVVEYNPTLDAGGADMKKLFDIFKLIAKLVSKYCSECGAFVL